jgi:hypothetical protein
MSGGRTYGMLTTVVTLLTLLGPTTAMPGAAGSGPSNPGVLPAQSHPFGRTYGEWSAAWWQYAFSVPVSVNPLFDETGIGCGVGQSGHVFFLVGVFSVSGTATRDRCEVPAGAALFFPILNVESDAANTPGVTETGLRDINAFYVGIATDLHASVDGHAVQNPAAYRSISPAFAITLPPTDDLESFFVGSPVIGPVFPAVGDGFYLMLAPLSAGPHTIRFGGTFGPP